MTRIFYLVLFLLTAAAAAVQWMPRDGFPPDIDLGPDQAHAQAGPQLRSAEPGVRTADARRVSQGPATIYPAAPAAPPAMPAYPATATPEAIVPGANPQAAPAATTDIPPSPPAPVAGAPGAAPASLPGTTVFPSAQYPGGQNPTAPYRPGAPSPSSNQAYASPAANPGSSPAVISPTGSYPTNASAPTAYPTTPYPATMGDAGVAVRSSSNITLPPADAAPINRPASQPPLNNGASPPAGLPPAATPPGTAPGYNAPLTVPNTIRAGTVAPTAPNSGPTTYQPAVRPTVPPPPPPSQPAAASPLAASPLAASPLTASPLAAPPVATPPVVSQPVATPPVARPPAPTPPPAATVGRPAATETTYQKSPLADPFGPTVPSGTSQRPPEAASRLADPGALPPAGGFPTNNVSAVGPSPTSLPLNASFPIAGPEQELEETRVLARVGGDVILAGEVLASVNSFIARKGHDFRSPEIMAQRDLLVRSRLGQLIELRAVLHEARRKVPPEAMKQAMKKFDEEFDNVIVPQMLKDRKLADVEALEESLKKEGTNLDRTRRDFAETVLFKSWLQQAVEYSKLVTHEDMLDHYQKHLSDYELIAECRWEQLSARFDKFPSKGEAYQNLAHWGNLIFIGRPWAEIAKTHSQGATASQGGAFDWTKKGSLVSKPIDDTIFSLPIGSMSPILEDETGFHIVRVVERKEGGRTPFTEAQAAIKKQILEERSETARKEYVEKIRKNAIVWNAFDDPDTAPNFNVKSLATRPATQPIR